ncbi:tetratricopeptide repeat protein [Pareuzebyella sediminis]|uniref:tetratricopeptide repeat protein n=1 Tax=Pareuzebyella sediminis TaxID=2607998 RepID=UPI0011EBBFC7|nr:tetratricopeptide repeat protein [Pareuzebyella sediminis]
MYKVNDRYTFFIPRIFLVLVGCLFGICSIQGQTTIAKLEFNGAEVTSTNISYTLPKQSPVSTIVNVNQGFASGTLFIIPENTVVWLTSNGNQQRLGPGSKHLAVVSANGESHQTFWGKVQHFVTNKLNFYKASGPSTKHQGAVKGTVFTVEAVGKDVKFATQEGNVAIEREVNVKIGEQAQTHLKKSRKLTSIQTTVLSAGEPEQYFDHEYEEELTYSSYEEAITFFRAYLEQAYMDEVDAEFLVDQYNLLGELYLDAGSPSYAKDAFERAIELYEEELDPGDPEIAVNYIGLGEALYGLGNYDTGLEYCNRALEIIYEDLAYNREDFKYFVNEEDYTTAWGIGLFIVDNYEDLAWCYEVLSNIDESNKYYDMADELKAQLNLYD